MIASFQKGRTFAIRFLKKEGLIRREKGSAQFFESLRPAQENGPHPSCRREADTGKGTQENESGTRDSEEKQVQQYYNEEFDPGSG